MNFSKKKKRLSKTASLNELLSGIIGEFNLEKSFTIESIRGIWSDIVGDIISTHTMPDRLTNGVLYINADHPVYSNEMMLMKDSILSSLSEKGLSPGIKDIRISVKKSIYGKSLW